MSIQDGDIKLLKSKVMADVPEGGGGPTGNVIEWGKSNQSFDDITEIDRAGGDVSIRQQFAAVQTGNTDALQDANIIIDQPATDPNVSVTIAACNFFAKRTEIATAIANYLIAGTEWNGLLLGNHVQGQGNVQIFHRVGTAAPPIGRTLVLVQDEGKPAEKRQFVRITRTDSVERTFTYMAGGTPVDYQAMVTTCDLSSRLDFAFVGSEPNREFRREANATMIRDTTVADAMQFYGASPMTAAYALGDTSRQVKVASIYTQLVPNSRTERVNLDQRPAAMRSITLATGPREVTVPITPHTYRFKVGQENRGYSWTTILRPFPSPGTLVASFMVLGTWYTCQDNGAGELVGDAVGTINYANGSIAITLPALPDVGSAVLFQWGETTGFVNRSSTLLQVRQPEYMLQLEHSPIPGTLEIEWESSGVLKTATDTVGVLAGDAVGEINYASGELLIKPSMAAWIDAQGEFSIRYQYATVITKNVTALPDAAGFATIALDSVPAAGSVMVQWVTARNVTASSGGSSTGASAGKASGKHMGALASTGGNFVPTVRMYGIPNGVSQQSSYSRSTVASSKTQELQTHTLTDDAAGSFGSRGTINYAGKSLTVKLIDLDSTTEGYQSTYEGSIAFETATMNGGSTSNSAAQKGGESATVAVSEQVLAASTVQVTYAESFASPLTAVQSWQPPAVSIDLCPYTSQYVVPGSVQFTWMGHTYQDVDGDLIRDRTASNPGTVAGRMDYQAGIAYLTEYLVTTTAALVLQSLWTTRKQWTAGNVFFRTPAAPVAVQGITLNLSDAQGNVLTLTPDLEGYFNTAQSRGRIDYQAGLTEIQFGAFVEAAALTAAERAEWWFDAADVGAVQAGKIWKPLPIDPTTLRFNSVTYVFLPLDADIIGMDPVRLPSDGRVPVYRNGYYVVVGHTAVLPAATLGAGQFIDCARTRLSRVWIVGADGQKIQTGWSVDLDAGLLSIADVTGWAQPVRVHHRIEEMARVADVQINGTLTLTKTLSHHFPAGSVVSSALYAGTIRARVSHLFDQATIDAVSWSDALVGNQAPAQYNDTAFPIGVTNAGALSERWLLKFTNTTTVEVIGEHVGNLGTFPIASDIAPANPNTRTDTHSGVPYFTVKAGGWGAGWAVGNGLRINTVGAMQPFACIRTVQPSEAAGTDYSFGLTVRGDVDRAPIN
ncbi:hypothetical protein D3C78_56430 [compost metagenome]